ncbi:glycoside-pentoside-hexuronide (GPH):cation symporter [Erythrobacter sp. F6033]|uniref:MFS transporter n=1 Tax=Erythrobacter sp. F6033 TaxID=2926401 RepID=UPI001FF16F3B|nr:glycoside-pentoside-hexuronide (GPH):cation symporter [Erythrobacter sp. F6033]MCK0127630.1 glycoside-pentoside-hexuronide (GPH):cation symporter [Erythrobacter sp. F6033]
MTDATKGGKVKRLVGYGIGDFGLNIYWNSLSFILVFWYTDVVGLDPKIAGWLFAAGLAWDAISDPFVANLAASNRSRFGVYRPFLLFGSIALGASFSLLFWRPDLEGWPLLAALLGAAILFRTCYTIVAVPYSALSARLTFNSVERGELSGVRMFFAFCALLCVMSFAFPLSREFGGNAGYTDTGFFKTATLGAVLATVALVACFLFTREKPPLGKDERQSAWSFSTFLIAFRENDALRSLLFFLLLNSAAGSALNISLVFYITSNGAAFAAKEVILTSFAVATLCGTPLWTFVVRSLGKKRTWYLATSIMAASGGLLFTMGPILVMGVPLQILAFGFANSAFAIIIWTLIPDTVEYGQNAHGRRDEGAIFGSSLFVQKSSGAITGLGIGYLLSGIGYEANLTQQTVGTTNALATFIAVVPPVLLIFAAANLFRMPLSRDLHARIVDKLSR